MRPIVKDLSRSVCLSGCLPVCLYMYLLVTTVSPIGTAEPIEVPFEVWTRVGRGSPGEGAIWGDISRSIAKYMECPA